MLDQSQSLLDRNPVPAGEISAADLLAQLAQHRGKKLIFRYEGRDEVDGDTVRVELTQRPASCKPRDRWLDRQKSLSSCNTSSTSAKPCCN